jgi:peptidoglycan-N-acetylglucosamine deacetylase
MEIWKGEFDYLYHRIGSGILNITMHPQVIGRGHRLLFLEEFMKYAAGHPGVSFTKCVDYVREWRKGRSPELPKDAGAARATIWKTETGGAPAQGKTQSTSSRAKQVKTSVRP